MAKVHHPDKAASCSFDGKEYAAAGDGSFDVPDAAVEALASHGFTTVAPAAPAPAPKKGKRG